MYGAFSYGQKPYGFLVPAPGDLETLFQSTVGFTTRPGDTPSNQFVPERVQAAFDYSRSLLSGDGLGGLVTQGLGNIVLENSDGFYDGVFRNFAIDGRQIRIKLGEEGVNFDDFALVWRGSAAGWSLDERELVIELRDLSFRLDRTMQTSFYAGTGGLEGGEDVAGSPKPVTLGQVPNITPVWLGAVDLGDGPLDTYQVNWRHIQDVTAVREAGLAYDKVTGVPAGGEYKVHASDGVFQVGATPLDRITCDVEGDAGAGGSDYVDTTSEIVRRLLSDFAAGLGPESMDLDSFDELAADVPGTIGVYFRDTEVNLSEAVGRVLAGVVAWGGFSRNALFEARQLKRPASSPAVTFEGSNILEPAPHILGPDRLPPELAIPSWRRRVGYKRNWTVQRDTIREGATTAAREFAQQEWRIAESTNTTTRARHLLASEPAMLESFLQAESDANPIADHLIDLFSGETRFVEVTTRVNFWLLDIGTTVRLVYPRFGLSQGRNGVIVSQRLNASQRTATYILFMPGAS